MPLSRSTGLLGNPPRVYSPGNQLFDQSEQAVGWALGNLSGWEGELLWWYTFVLQMLLSRVTDSAHIFSHFDTISGVDPLSGLKPQQQFPSSGEADHIACCKKKKKKKSDKMLHHCRFWWCYFQIASPVHGGPVIPCNCLSPIRV